MSLSKIKREIFKVSEYIPSATGSKKFVALLPNDLQDIIFIANDNRYSGFSSGYSISCGGIKINLPSGGKKKEKFSFTIKEPGEYRIVGYWYCHQKIRSNEIIVRVLPK